MVNHVSLVYSKSHAFLARSEQMSNVVYSIVPLAGSNQAEIDCRFAVARRNPYSTSTM
jgi:hypothetical protein